MPEKRKRKWNPWALPGYYNTPPTWGDATDYEKGWLALYRAPGCIGSVLLVPFRLLMRGLGRALTQAGFETPETDWTIFDDPA